VALSLRRALGLRRGGRGVDEVAGAVIGRPGRDEVVRGPVRRDPPRRASRLARVPRPVHSSTQYRRLQPHLAVLGQRAAMDTLIQNARNLNTNPIAIELREALQWCRRRSVLGSKAVRFLCLLLSLFPSLFLL
jgi:hypothetical protein